MSLEEALAANTAALKELTAALLAAGALQSAQTSAAAHSSPAVQAVVKAQKEADEANRKANPKGGEHESAEAARAASQEQSRTAAALAAEKKQAAVTGANASAASAPSGEPSASTLTSSSSEQPSELQAWHEKTAKLFGELDGSEPTLDNLRKAVLGINQHIGRPQAMAILQRFGAQAITPKLGPDGKTVITAGLDDDQYPEAFALCLEVLAGRVDATAAVTE